MKLWRNFLGKKTKPELATQPEELVPTPPPIPKVYLDSPCPNCGKKGAYMEKNGRPWCPFCGDWAEKNKKVAPEIGSRESFLGKAGSSSGDSSKDLTAQKRHDEVRRGFDSNDPQVLFQALVQALENFESYEYYQADFRRIGTRLIIPMIEIMKRPDIVKAVKLNAAWAIENDLINSTCVDLLLQLMDSPDANIRWSATISLGKIGSAGTTPVVKRLLMAFKDKNYGVRTSAAEAFHNLWVKREGSDTILQAVKAEEVFLLTCIDYLETKVNVLSYVAVVEILGAIGEKRIVPVLEKDLTNDSWEIRKVAVKTLDKLGWQPPSTALAIITAAVKNDWPAVRKYGKAAEDLLISALRDGTLPIEPVLNALTNLWTPEAESAVISVMKNNSPNSRFARNLLNDSRSNSRWHIICPNCNMYLGVKNQLLSEGHQITQQAKKAAAIAGTDILANWYYVCPHCGSKVLL